MMPILSPVRECTDLQRLRNQMYRLGSSFQPPVAYSAQWSKILILDKDIEPTKVNDTSSNLRIRKVAHPSDVAVYIMIHLHNPMGKKHRDSRQQL